MASIKARVGSQNVVRVLSNSSTPPSNLLDLSDVNSFYKDRDGLLLVWDNPTGAFIMTSVIDASSITFKEMSLTDLDDISVSGIATFKSDVDFQGDVNATNGLNVVGFISTTDALYYAPGNFDGPNGVAFFDNSGKLTGAASTESGISTSNYILTTQAGIGTPVWTDTIDGGLY